MARINADLIDGGDVATPSKLQTDTGNRGQTPSAPAPTPAPASSGNPLLDYVASLNGMKSSLQEAKTVATDIASIATTTKAEAATQATETAALAKGLGATVDAKTGMVTPPAGGYTPQSLAAAAQAAAVTTPTTSPSALSTLDAAQLDAYAILEDAFKQYGLEDLIPTIEGYMKNNVGPQQASLLLKQTDAYKTRFAGNYGPNGRVAQGLNAISESEYLTLENKYNETLNSYGLNDYFGTTAKAKQTGMANIIGNDISAPEFQNRVQLAEDNVVNADPQVLATLKQYYPAINGTDLLKYYLDPGQNLAALTMKTTAAGIGAAAVNQGLNVNAERAMFLAQNNVTATAAQKGYATIGEEVPVAAKLGSIYNASGVTYGQTDAEAQQFNLAGAASAQRKRQQLIDLEQGSFNGRSGINTNINPLGKGLQGSF